MVRKALLTTQVRGRRWKKQVQIGCLILHFSKGKTPFEVHRNTSKDCSSYHFSVILYHAPNLKAQVPFERLILIFLPFLIPFSPLAAISSLIQPPVRRNRIIWRPPLNYQREIYAGESRVKAAFILQKLKDQVDSHLKSCSGSSPQPKRCGSRVDASPGALSHPGAEELSSGWLCLGGCRYSRAPEPGEWEHCGNWKSRRLSQLCNKLT